MKTKLFAVWLTCIALLGLTGCDMTLSNLTPERVPENPSGIYTLSAKPHIQDGEIIPQSIHPHIVIDGVTHPMVLSQEGTGVYEFDYSMPKGQSQSRYYYVLDYDLNRKAGLKHQQLISQLYDLKLTNRYVVTLDCARGPVGATIGVVGRGFSKYDHVLFDDQEIATTYYSNNALSFVVPSLPAQHTYCVGVRSGGSILPAGSFTIDSLAFRVLPAEFSLVSGERAVMMISIDYAAPQGGLPLSILTDVPQSVIMPEVTIPEGSRSVSVPLEAGQVGTGMLYINANGFYEYQVPIKVLSKEGDAFEHSYVEPLDPQIDEASLNILNQEDTFNPYLQD